MTHTSQFLEFETPIIDQHGQVIRHPACQVQTITEDLGQDITLEFAVLPGGAFLMGSPRGLGSADEQPQHRVVMPPFLAGRHLITQEQWTHIMRNPPSCRFKGQLLPVENVSWFEARKFCERLTQKIGRKCHLPSEAHWEYACRAGTLTPYHYGETITTDLANYCGEHTFREEPKGIYRHMITPVGSFPANAFGLFDMHGNLWEWCADYWHDHYAGAPSDEKAWVSEGDPGFRVIRGGSWHEVPDACRSAARAKFGPDQGDDLVGFRVMAEWRRA